MGYETNYGAFAEYTKVKSSQLIKKPKDLDWKPQEVIVLHSLQHTGCWHQKMQQNLNQERLV